MKFESIYSTIREMASKTIALLTVVVILTALLTTACTENTLEDYKSALEKTENIQRGKTHTDLELQMNFEMDGLDEEEARQLKSFENIEYEGTSSFDYTGDQAKVESINLLSLGGLGMNFDYYQLGDEMALYIPMLGKFLNLTSQDIDKLSEDTDNLGKIASLQLTDETVQALENVWKQTFEADEVIKGEDSIMETPEGDVRVVKFTIEPDKEKLKDFVKKTTEIIVKDENIQAEFGEMSFDNGKVLKAEDFLSGLDDAMEKWQVQTFKVVDFIDVDGYIVQTTVNISIKMDIDMPGAPNAFNMTLETTNYEIEKNQSIDFPELTEENSLSIQELEQGLPSTYENLIE